MCVGNYNPQTCVWGNYNPEKAIQPPAPTQSDCGLSLMARRQPPPEHHSLMSSATQCVRLQRNSVGVWLGWLRWIKRQNSKHGKGHLDRHLCHLYKSLLKSRSRVCDASLHRPKNICNSKVFELRHNHKPQKKIQLYILW